MMTPSQIFENIPNAYMQALYAPYELGAFRFALKEGDPEQTFWTLSLTKFLRPATDADVAALEAEGWERFGAETKDSFHILSANLSPTLIVEQDKHWSGFWWQTSDRQYAQTYPVLLGFLDYGGPTFDDVPIDVVPGKQALIFEGKTVHLYSIDRLGEQGLGLYTSIENRILPIYREGASIDEKLALSHKRLEHWQQTSDATKQLAVLYWQLHQTVAVKQAIHLPANIPHIMRGGAYILFPQVVQGVLVAYSNAQQGATEWTIREHLPTFISTKAKDMTQVQLRPQNANVIVDEAMMQSLWQQVRTFSDLDGDVFLALLAQWLAVPHDEKGLTWITAEHILEYRGICPRKHKDGSARPTGHRQEDIAQIAESMNRIRDTHVTVQQWIKDEQPTGKR
ncbi:MAG: hypothetical protein M3Z24_13640, partial [Chloroflexota bacterium]|nr:hypothetical protein [Chloroflexota bacterium]